MTLLIEAIGKKNPDVLDATVLEASNIYSNASDICQSKGIIRALHLCRGHFKTFNDKPLFGRIRGRFWWGQIVRGNAEKGVVMKRYEIAAS